MTYTPINCNLYDFLEEAATLKLKNIFLLDNGDGLFIKNGQIVDLFSKERVEYLKLKSGTKIRLDTIVEFNGVDFKNEVKCDIEEK